jgi:hypothetical protein
MGFDPGAACVAALRTGPWLPSCHTFGVGLRCALAPGYHLVTPPVFRCARRPAVFRSLTLGFHYTDRARGVAVAGESDAPDVAG